VTSSFRRHLVVSVTLLAAGFASWAVDAQDAALTPPELTTRPLAAEWTYSTDGGQTFTTTPPKGAFPQEREGLVPLTFRGTFEIGNPAQVAGLWVRIAEPGDAPKATICDGNLIAASGGNWKDLTACPTLLDARVTLNGKPVQFARGHTLAAWYPVVEPLQPGRNTIEVSGNCYTHWQGQPATAITARLLMADPQAAGIYSGPLLGDFGPSSFSVACRTRLPAELTVVATPTTPAAAPVTARGPRGVWHRIKVDLPPGTMTATYMLTSQSGGITSSAGPFTVRLLDAPDAGYRFVALGNIMADASAKTRWANTAALVRRLDPAFIVHTGNCNMHSTWDSTWEDRYFAPIGGLLASVPTLFTPAGRDFGGAVHELHVTPAIDGYGHTWAKPIGPVRFIGIDGSYVWAVGDQNYAWLEEQLAAAKEKFVFVLCGFPAYASGGHSKRPSQWLAQNREVIMPLLGKYRVSAMISGQEAVYERCEPTPDLGCTQIVTGAAGRDAIRFSGRAATDNPFGKGKGHDWAGAEDTPSLCVFEVRPDRVEMKALSIPDGGAEPRVLDTKAFLPR
jgi:hypothetical protein